MANVLKPRRGRASTIAALNPVLENGEMCLEFPDTGVGTGLGKVKVGDGVTPWNDLEYFITYDSTEYIKMDDIGQPGGPVPLDGAGKIDPQFLPSYVEDVLEYPSFADFPAEGERGKIYIDTSKKSNNVYRWGGTQYFVMAHSVTYELVKEGSNVLLKGSDGSVTSVANVGGIEVRKTDPTPAELYPGKMWILTI